MTGPAATVLDFAADQVPCVPQRLDDAFFPLRWRAQADPYWADLAARVLAGAPAEPEALHRHLIAAGRDPELRPVHPAVQAALRVVREHSRLYTPRSCDCLREAWADFTGRADAALTAAQDGGPGPWSVAGPGGTYYDLQQARLDALLPYAGRRCYAGHSSRHIPDRVHLAVSAERIELVMGRGRRARAFTFDRLRPERAALVNRVRWGSGGAQHHTAASWVRDWPEQLVTAFAAWVEVHRGGAAEAEALLAAGVADLDPDALTAFVALARGWRAGPEQLLETARRVAA